MTILDEIIACKHQEIAERKAHTTLQMLENSTLFARPVLSLKQSLLDPAKTGIIAEHKRKSPSRGIINQQLTVEEVTQGYVQGGASALSVLTDMYFFDGADQHLTAARQANPSTPILRKDFIIDEYQLVEARSLGADAVLLIAANLTTTQCRELAWAARNLGLEVLLEVHDRPELEDYLNEYIDVVGVNNRDLKRMRTDLDTSRQLSALIPPRYLKISESGIHAPQVLLELRDEYGYHGFLIGEYFMQQQNPGAAFAEFASKIK